MVGILLCLWLNSRCSDTLSVCSPSGKICVKIWMDKNLKYGIYENGVSILEPSEADMLLSNNQSFSYNNSIKSHVI
jgi:alpha-glucosidase